MIIIFLAYWSFRTHSLITDKEIVTEFGSYLKISWIFFTTFFIDSFIGDFIACSDIYLKHYNLEDEELQKKVSKACSKPYQYITKISRILFLIFLLLIFRIKYKISHYLDLVMNCNKYVEESGEIPQADIIVSFFSFCCCC